MTRGAKENPNIRSGDLIVGLGQVRVKLDMAWVNQCLVLDFGGFGPKEVLAPRPGLLVLGLVGVV